MDQSEGPGMGALEGRTLGKGLDRGVLLIHWAVEGYVCNPGEDTVEAVGRDTLWDIVKAHTEKQKVVGEYNTSH